MGISLSNPGYGANLHAVDTEVYNAVQNPSAWTDLDLSGVVGAKQTLVLLRVTQASGAAKGISFRRNGETEIAQANSTGQRGLSNNLCVSAAPTWCLAQTDANGICEWYIDDNSVTVVIDVVTYVN